MALCWRVLILLSFCAARTLSLPQLDPSYYNYQWDEPPDSPIFIDENYSLLTREQSEQRLESLRAILRDRNIDAYIIPTGDAHNSQYISPTDARREWISGLSGSSGTAVVTATEALVWTDARYFTQFYIQVNTEFWSLMRQGIDLTIEAWLVQNLNSSQSVAVDPTTYTRTQWNSLEANLQPANIALVASDVNLVDLSRVALNDPAPPRPNNDLLTLSVEFSGQVSSEKISTLSSQISSRGATALVLTALDDIAYTLNLRGWGDIPYNPVFFSYLIIRTDLSPSENVILFWGNGTLEDDVLAHLNSEGTQITARPYEDIFNYVRNMSTTLPPGSTLWLSSEASHAIHSAAEGDGYTYVLSTISPVVMIKYIKNVVELAGFRSAHVKDGTAVTRFLRWLHQEVAAGVNVTEMDASRKLVELRSDELDFIGPSFSTIAGVGENGAVIHYSPSDNGPQRVIGADEMFLVDSGGQYRDGTTDITRTRHMSAPSAAQREAFTRVLKGQISLATVVFPRGVVGHRLETLARRALWDVGLDYGHGTGHGVGHFLNVHEGPSWILSGPVATDPGIVVGMIFSNEPGFYEVDEYGIRHEDLVEVIQLTPESDHIMASTLVGDFGGLGALGFNTISLAPHQTSSLDVELMTDFEIKYLNDYHAKVLATIGPILLERNLQEDYDFLAAECAPIARSAAILLTIAPLTFVGVVFNLWLF